ncbi:MAG: alcohol dehydrogenase catalytic domain-containing protein, partial [Bacteroidota bacterium]
MQALICNDFGPISQLEVKEVATPSIKAHEVLVDIKAAGVNFPDMLMVQGLYQMKPALPFVPGAEFSGVVQA